MILSTPGLLGAVGGLLFALGIYIAMATAWRRNMQDLNTSAEQRERFQRMWPIVQIALIADFIILGWLGYTAGTIIGS